MELSRVEYPAIVNSVPPSPAVKLVRERLQKAQTLNTEIADWLQERKRAEEAYALALGKLAKRPAPGEKSDLGVFSGPWHKIVESTASLATVHNVFAQKIADEVEKPIRDFATRNTDWSGMKSLEANLSTIAKNIQSAEEKADKLQKRGQKAKPQQVAEAASAVSSAQAEWDSQAPFVFEKLEVADEARCNNLRDALTRLQTLELDTASSTSQSAEAILGTLLDISAADETKTFANRATLGRHKLEKQHSRTGTRGSGTIATPSIITDDSMSVRSSQSGQAHGIGGLKRLGTVLRNRGNRNSIFHRSSSPDRRTGRGPPPIPPSPRRESNHPTNNDSVPQASQSTLDVPSTMDRPQPNGDTRPQTAPTGPPPAVTVSEPKTDSEGYTIPPPPMHEAAFQAAGATAPEDEESHPQFKVEIKNEVIHEEEEDADAALSKVANTLRAQPTVSRKSRGRRDARDVRNTMFFPTTPDLSEYATSSPPLTPVRMSPRASNVASEAGSDTQSVRSSRSMSLMSLGGGSNTRHPDILGPGLQGSLIESVSVTFVNGNATKAQVAGEIALAYHAEHDDADMPSSLHIRLDNFSILEKVAPNPGFVSPVMDHAGEYTISPTSIRRTSVAFKYQVHLDDTLLRRYCPIIVTAFWKVEEHQSSVIVTWTHNPEYVAHYGALIPFQLRNFVLVTGVDGAHTTACQSKPNGAYSRERGRISWKLGETPIDPANNSSGKLVARFATEGPAKPAPVDVRWEITGEQAEALDSGLTVSLKVETAKGHEDNTDPFADTTDDASVVAGDEEWQRIRTIKKIVSGKFTAVM